MLFDSNKNKGKAGLAIAIGYYGSNGYVVSVPLDDTQDYDLVVEKDGVLYRVQVKATGYKPKGNYVASLRNTGGTNGSVYGIVIESSADLLFILTEEGSMYEYRVAEITNRNALTVSEEFRVHF